MVKDTKFSFGSNPKMLEVPLGKSAEFEFTGEPKIVETEWGEKYSFPISLLSHDSYDSFPIKCDWESKSQVAKELHDVYHNTQDTPEYAAYLRAYSKSEWVLTRFDNGSYWIDSQ